MVWLRRASRSFIAAAMLAANWPGPAFAGRAGFPALWTGFEKCDDDVRDVIADTCVRIKVIPAFFQSPAGVRWSLPLPAGKEVFVSGSFQSFRDERDAVWEGDVVDDPYGTASFVQVNHGLVGRVSLSTGDWYRLRLDRDGNSLLEGLKRNVITPDLPARVVPPLVRKSAKAVCPMDLQGPIRILVVYTPAARDYFEKTTEELSAWISLAMSDADRSFEVSKAATRVILADVRPTTYKELNMGTDHLRLIDANDEYLNEIHGWRKDAAADLVVLVTQDPQDSGVASQFTNDDLEATDFASRAFAVVSVRALTGSFVFTHEIGHLMGALHDEQASKGTVGAYNWSHGSFQENPTAPCLPWKSIMAWCPKCAPRLIWSNPMADACGDAMGGKSTEDNARTISDTAPTIENLNCGL